MLKNYTKVNIIRNETCYKEKFCDFRLYKERIILIPAALSLKKGTGLQGQNRGKAAQGTKIRNPSSQMKEGFKNGIQYKYYNNFN